LVSKAFQAYAADSPTMRPELHPSKSFPIHHSAVIVLIDTDGDVKLKTNVRRGVFAGFILCEVEEAET